jgi:hypothetical protein
VGKEKDTKRGVASRRERERGGGRQMRGGWSMKKVSQCTLQKDPFGIQNSLEFSCFWPAKFKPLALKNIFRATDCKFYVLFGGHFLLLIF